MRKKQILPIAAAVFACCMILTLGMREMLSPDETRYAEIAREMLLRNDWVTPYLNGIVYFEKPVFGYWAMALSMKCFGETALAVRFVSMLATLLTGLTVAGMAGKLHREDDRFRYLAGGIFLFTPLVFFLGQIAILDPLFTFFVTLGTGIFYSVTQEPWSRKGIALQLLSGMVFGLAFLTKGFLAFALPASALFLYYLIPERFSEWKTGAFWKRAFSAWFLLPWIPFAGAVLVSLPWALAIHQAQPEFWRYFLVEEHFQRFTKTIQHPEPFWFFVPVLAAGLGYLLFTVTIVWKGLRGRVFSDALLRYAFFWALGPFLFLSASTGKLITYILPCYPPLAILIAEGIFRQAGKGEKSRFLNFFLCLTGIAAVPVALAFLLPRLFPDNPLYSGPFADKAVTVSLLGAVLCFGCFAAFAVGDLWKKFTVMGCALAPLLIFWAACFPRFAVESRSPSAMIRRSAVELGITPETAVMSFRDPLPAVCWELKRDDVIPFDNPGELSRGLDFMKRESSVLSLTQTAKWLQSSGRPEKVVIYMSNSLAEEYLPSLPPPKKIVRDTPWRKSYCAILF